VKALRAHAGSNVIVYAPTIAKVDETVDLTFAPPPAHAEPVGEIEVKPGEEPPEPLVGGTLDLGAIATEFLILGLDPYPRRPDVVFETPPAGDEPAHPFAALAGLKKGQGGGQR
jgi:hypothetical protein